MILCYIILHSITLYHIILYYIKSYFTIVRAAAVAADPPCLLLAVFDSILASAKRLALCAPEGRIALIGASNRRRVLNRRRVILSRNDKLIPKRSVRTLGQVGQVHAYVLVHLRVDHNHHVWPVLAMAASCHGSGGSGACLSLSSSKGGA